jgi:hypothetical protein
VEEKDEEDIQVDKPRRENSDRMEMCASALAVVWFRRKNPIELEKYLQRQNKGQDFLRPADWL